MAEKKVLVIDDSATIRKLVDSQLSPAGYAVSLAPTAEDGLQMAAEIHPDLILLDHQLPGTTGFEVCQQLAASSTLCSIPVVVSSTLRKKAYVEYADLDNVVDMLPKPYTENLLITTVENAIETAAMIVESQSKGSAVPEIIGDASEPDIAGRFAMFGIREIIDLLNNGNQKGVLEIEAERLRLWIYINGGRIQGITATGLQPDEVQQAIDHLPESLKSLGEVLRLTIAGRSSSEFEGFLQLMDKRVLDPRLTAKLLRYQAATLMGLVKNRKLLLFRFNTLNEMPALPRDLPLETSLMGLLVDYALHCDAALIPQDDPANRYKRAAARGQNMDRAGLSPKHMKIISLLTEERSVEELTTRTGWDREEVRRVLAGFVMAEILECTRNESQGSFVTYETNAVAAAKLRAELKADQSPYQGKIVRDTLTLQLLLKRTKPDAVFIAVDSPESCAQVREAYTNAVEAFGTSKIIALAPAQVVNDPNTPWQDLLGFTPSRLIQSPYSLDSIMQTMGEVADLPAPATASIPAAETAELSPPATAVDPAIESGSNQAPTHQ